MTDKLFADTNLLIYLHDLGEKQKRAAALDWFAVMVQSRSLVVSVQVLNEFYAAAVRRFPATPREEFRVFVDDLRPACTAAFTLDTIDRAREIQDAAKYHWYACLIVAAAMASGCRYLVTEDLDHGRSIGGTTIIDPFRVSPKTLLPLS
jgi:predicted nucleic acid-binding protein